MRHDLPIGRRCAAASRAFYCWPGDPPKPDALELAWEDGATTVFDTKSDWSLKIADGSWRDPFDGIDTDDPSWDLGKWTKGSVAGDEPVAAVVGAALREVVPRFNEVADLVGVDLKFDTITVRVEGHAGDLTVRPVANSSDGG
jgi:hypothetical protein